MNENQVHKAIVGHLRYRGIVRMLPMHIANNPRGPRDGARLKAMGLLAGAPDMAYALYDGQIVWHEIKTEEGKLSHVQKDVHERLRQLGHQILVSYGLDDALKLLTKRGIIIGG